MFTCIAGGAQNSAGACHSTLHPPQAAPAATCRGLRGAPEPTQHSLPAFLRAGGPARGRGAQGHEERDLLEGEWHPQMGDLKRLRHWDGAALMTWGRICHMLKGKAAAGPIGSLLCDNGVVC